MFKNKENTKKTDLPDKKKKRKHKLRENIESIAIAVALAFAIRYFVVEAFKIPTGSMAPTLLGVHKDVSCPNCNWSFYADRQSETATCPNCQFEINTSLYCTACNGKIRYNWPPWLWRKGTCPACQTKIAWKDLSNRVTHGGNRILVNKFWYTFTKPKRWDVMVFVYPFYDIKCKNCSVLIPDVKWRDSLSCPRCGSTKFSKKKKNYIKRLIGLPGEKLQIVNGDIYINDAFSVSHREHASIVGLPKKLPSFTGFLFEEELKNLSKVFSPEHPFLFILGGAKTETKLPLFAKFIKTADYIFIGGVLANDFLKARGFEVGKSLVSKGIEEEIIRLSQNSKVILSQNVIVGNKDVSIKKSIGNVSEEDAIKDVVVSDLEVLERVIQKSKFILWNGPMGNLEEGFLEGTQKLAKLISQSPAKSIMGGGDTISALGDSVLEKFSFVSTAGGAMLDFLANETLPGIEALELGN